MEIKQMLKSWVLIALGVLIASQTSSGIHYADGQALFFAVILLSLCNVLLKPILMLFSLPFIILTFGIGIWLINALLFMLVSQLVPGFFVDTFWNGLWGAFVVSLTSCAANIFFGGKGARSNVRFTVNRGRPGQGSSNTPNSKPKPKPIKDDDDVIDI
jgi:putative membrane protein